MLKSRKIAFVVADSARARIVARSHESHDFVTLREIFADDDGHVPATAGAGRRPIHHKADPRSRARAEFADEIASLASTVAAADYEGVVLAAPARLLSDIRDKIGGRLTILGEVAKDLTKTPNHELGRWLQPVEVGLPLG